MDIACFLFDGITALDIDRALRGAAAPPGRGREVRRASSGRDPHRQQVPRARRRLRASTRSRAPTSSSCPAASRTPWPRARQPRRSTGSARSTPTARGRRRCAPARCCSPRPACSKARRRRRTGRRSTALSRVRRDPDRAARRRAGQDHHRGRRVVGHRHGAHARGARSPATTFAQAIQLGIEYDPQPPFDAGSVDKASDRIVELLASMYADRLLTSHRGARDAPTVRTLSGRLLGDDDGGAVAEEALVDRQADAGALDLAAVGLAVELPGELAHLRDRLRGHGFAEAGEAAARRSPGCGRRCVVAPSRSSFSASPGAHRPICSYQSSSIAVERS